MYPIWTSYTRAAVLILNVIDHYAQEAGNVPLARPLGSLRYLLEAQEAPTPRITFDPPIEMVVRRNNSGFYLFYGLQRLPNNSTQRLSLPGTAYRLHISSPSGMYQDAYQVVSLPLPDLNSAPPANSKVPNPLDKYTILLEPGPNYRFDGIELLRLDDPSGKCSPANYPGRAGPSILRGSLHTAGGTPIAKADISTKNPNSAGVSADNGEWLLWFLDRPTGPVEVLMKYPGTKASDPPLKVPDVCLVRGYETRLGQTAVSGVVEKNRRPFAGAVVTIPNFSGHAVSGQNGVWTYYFPIDLIIDQNNADVSPTITLPDGSKKTLNPIKLLERRTVLVQQVTRFP